MHRSYSRSRFRVKHTERKSKSKETSATGIPQDVYNKINNHVRVSQFFLFFIFFHHVRITIVSFVKLFIPYWSWLLQTDTYFCMSHLIIRIILRGLNSAGPTRSRSSATLWCVASRMISGIKARGVVIAYATPYTSSSLYTGEQSFVLPRSRRPTDGEPPFRSHYFVVSHRGRKKRTG